MVFVLMSKSLTEGSVLSTIDFHIIYDKVFHVKFKVVFILLLVFDRLRFDTYDFGEIYRI